LAKNVCNLYYQKKIKKQTWEIIFTILIFLVSSFLFS